MTTIKLIKLAEQLSQKYAQLDNPTNQVSLSDLPLLKSALQWLRNNIVAIADPSQYKTYWKDYQGLYAYIEKNKIIPVQFLNNDYKNVLHDLNLFLSRGTVSFEEYFAVSQTFERWYSEFALYHTDTRTSKVLHYFGTASNFFRK